MEKSMKKVCVAGLGFVGIPTALRLYQRAVSGILEAEILGYDTAKNTTFEELKNRFREYKPLNFEIPLHRKEIPVADVYFICVPTGLKNEEPDISAIWDVCNKIQGLHLEGKMIVLKSTVPIGTTLKIQEMFQNENHRVFYYPEKIMPGQALTEDFARVLGYTGELEFSEIEKYIDPDFWPCSYEAAEAVKLIENTHRDVQIAFANEMAALCKKNKLNFWEVRDLVNLHPRVYMAEAGAGVGGACIPIAGEYLKTKTWYRTLKLTQAARDVNLKRIKQVYTDVSNLCMLRDFKQIVLAGIGFKPDCEIKNNSPAMQFMALARQFMDPDKTVIQFWDPLVKAYENRGILHRAELIVFLVKHREFVTLKPQEINEYPAGKNVYDACGAISRARWETAGWKVYGIPKP